MTRRLGKVICIMVLFPTTRLRVFFYLYLREKQQNVNQNQDRKLSIVGKVYELQATRNLMAQMRVVAISTYISIFFY